MEYYGMAFFHIIGIPKDQFFAPRSNAVRISGGGCGQPVALRRHHLGHGAGHRPGTALCSAADERPAECLLRVCLAVDGEQSGYFGLSTRSSVLTFEDSLATAGARDCLSKARISTWK